MAVPSGIPVEQSISEIDAEIRMEDIRQSPAARLKMEHFHAVIKKNLMDKKLNYEAEHRKEILEGLRHMKRRLPAESGSSLVKKLENLAVNLECYHQNEDDTFLMKNDDLTLSIHHKNDQAIGAKIYYFGDEFPTDNDITRRINNNEWEDLRIVIHSMIRTIPSMTSKDMKQKLSRYRQSLEQNMRNKWKGGVTATISQLNESSVGWPAPGTSVRPLRIFLYGEPGVEFEMKEKGIEFIDPEKGDIPYAEIVIVENDKDNFFSFDGTRFSFPGVVKLELSSRWLLSAYTVEQLKNVGARPTSILQKTNLIRMIANCQMKDGDIELVGNELDRDVRYLVKGEVNEKDVIVDSLVIENGERLEEILLILHHQALFNSSWESIVASCCVQSLSSSHSVQFEMSTQGCNWEIVFTGNGSMYHVRVNPSPTRHWTLNIFSHHNGKLSDLADEMEGAFNGTWSLSKCLAHLVTRLGINGYEWKADASMDTSLPPSDCSLVYESKVGPAWLKKDIPPLPPPTKHEYRVVLPKGRCPLLRMMREVRPRPPLKVARPRPALSNPTVPPLRVNLLQPHPTQTPFNHIENMVNRVDEGGRSTGSPMGSSGMEGTCGMYGHPGYSNTPMGMQRMGVPPGTSPLVRGGGGGGGVGGMGGVNPSMPPYGVSPQQELMRQQLARQQSSTSISNSGVFDFPDESGSSPSSVNDFSPGYTGYAGYAPPQSPLVRGGGTTKAPRRSRGRKSGNVGDRTPGSSIDSPSPSPFSPDTKRPKSGPGSRGGRGSRGKRGISMDQSMSPHPRSVSEMSNSMSSPLTASGTPLPYSQQSFDDGTSDDECDPPPFSRSLSSIQSTSSSTVVAPSRLSSTPSSSFTISSSPLATPVSQSFQSTPSLISVVPSPLVPSSTSILASVLSAPSIPPPIPQSLPSSFSSSIPSTIPSSISSTIPSSLPPSIPPSTSSSISSPHPSITPSLVRRKSSLESIVGQLSATQTSSLKKKVVPAPSNDLFDTGLGDSPPSPPSSHSSAPILYAETKTQSPKKEGGEEKIVLKLKKTTKEPKKKEKNLEKEKDKEKRKEEKTVKSGEERDRKRKADSWTKEKKEKEAKKAKMTDPPLVGGDNETFGSRMVGSLKGFKIPKTGTKGPGDISIPSSSFSLVPPLPSPVAKPSLSTPSTSFSSQSRGGSSQVGVPPFRPPSGGGPIKERGGGRGEGGGGGPTGRQSLSSRPQKGILKSSGPPGPPSGPHGRPSFPPERKSSHPPYQEPPRSRQPSGGSGYLHPHNAPPPMRRPPLLPNKGGPSAHGHPSSSNWVPLQSRGGPLPPHLSSDGPPTLTPAISGPNLSSRLDHPPTLESNLPSRSIIDDSPASPCGLFIDA